MARVRYIICFMRGLPVIVLALRKRGMRWRWAVVGKKKNDEAKEGVANSKKASNKNHSKSCIVFIKDVQKKGEKRQTFSHKGIHIKLQVNSDIKMT